MDEENKKTYFHPYDPHQDRHLYRFLAYFLAGFAILATGGAVVVACFGLHEISLITMGAGSTCLGALIMFFTQNIKN